jgi:hypothetical protein
VGSLQAIERCDLDHTWARHRQVLGPWMMRRHRAREHTADWFYLWRTA